MQRAVLRLRLRVTYASFPALATLIGVLAAIVGFAAATLTAGHEAPSRAGGSLVAGDAVLQYFRGWRPVAAPRIPGLELSRPAALAPESGVGTARLIVGELRAPAGSALPPGLVARLRAPARVSVVSFGAFDAYRYDGLRIVGFDRPLILYTVPGRVHTTAVACYAGAGSQSYLQTCQRMAATLDPGGASPDSLTPSSSYAHAVTAAIHRLDAQRRTERPRLRGEQSAGQAAVAARLATAYTAAARAVEAAAAPNPVTAVDQRLLGRLRSGAAAYNALESAARVQDRGAYEAARTAVDTAEANASTTLAELDAFGYGRTVSPPRPGRSS
jgi:hypothetical protein